MLVISSDRTGCVCGQVCIVLGETPLTCRNLHLLYVPYCSGSWGSDCATREDRYVARVIDKRRQTKTQWRQVGMISEYHAHYTLRLRTALKYRGVGHGMGHGGAATLAATMQPP
jgi:hypothetical protein